MSYQTQSHRLGSGAYEFGYGRGRKRLKAVASMTGPRSSPWVIEGTKLAAKTLADLKHTWGEWARRRYAGEATDDAVSAAGEPAGPTAPPPPDAAEELVEAELDTDGPEPLRAFQPRDDYERGLLDAARFFMRRDQLMFTRIRACEHLLSEAAASRRADAPPLTIETFVALGAAAQAAADQAIAAVGRGRRMARA